MRRLLFAVPILFTLVLAVSGQCPIDTREPFKIALAQTVSSATARASDYVQFTTLEDIYSTDRVTAACLPVLIPKGTSVFGLVTDRKHRHFPFINGRLEVEPVKLKVWNGDELDITIERHTAVSGHKAPRACRGGNTKCIAGRKNGATAPIVAGVAAAGAAAIAAAAGKDTTRIIAATALFTILSQTDVAQILNGTDAELDEKEVFDMRITTRNAKMPPLPKAPQ
jgi:hypothetical protein